MKAIRIRQPHTANICSGGGKNRLPVLIGGEWHKVDFTGFTNDYDMSKDLVAVSHVAAYSITGVINFIELGETLVLGVMWRENSVSLLLGNDGLLIKIPGAQYVEPDIFKNPDSEVVYVEAWQKR